MKRFTFIVLAASIIMFSCNGGKQSASTIEDNSTDTIDSVSICQTDSIIVEEYEEESDEPPMPKSADEFFDDFFFKYVYSNKLQKSRTVFPLEVNEADSTFFISKADWVMDEFFTEQEYYTLIFDSEEQMEIGKDTSVDSVVVEKIMLTDSIIRNYVFERKNGLWMLTAINRTELSENANAAFLDFYKRFASDKEFQNKSLCESVKFITTDTDDDFNTMEGVITSESWPAFAPELPVDVIYNIIYSRTNPESKRKIFLLRGISNGLEVQLDFIFEQGRWKLAQLTT